jgi:hypothetical protein
LILAFTSLLILSIVSASSFSRAAYASSNLRGVIYDDRGNPISEAEVYLLEGRRLIESSVTGPEGAFEFTVD